MNTILLILLILQTTTPTPIAPGQNWIPQSIIYRSFEDIADASSLYMDKAIFRILSPTLYFQLPSTSGFFERDIIFGASSGISQGWEKIGNEWIPWPVLSNNFPDTEWSFTGNGSSEITLPDSAIKSSVQVEANVYENSTGGMLWINRYGLSGNRNNYHFEEVLDATGNCIGIRSKDVWDQGVKFRVYYRRLR